MTGRRRWQPIGLGLVGLVMLAVVARIGFDPAGADDREWAPLTLVEVVEPEEWGAAGDGSTDDTEAIQRAVDALTPQGGGIVWLSAESTYRTTDVIRITGDHIKLWAPNGRAAILATTGGEDRQQALIVDGTTGVGLFGVVLRSDANRRRTALEDSAVALVDATGTELVGLEVTNSASAAIFVFGGSRHTWVEGNHLHHNWADAIHFTDGSRQAWVWDNVIFNEAPAAGDDGVACVTYGSGRRCGEMEWWSNTHLGGDWGRGLVVVGGDDIHIHHNVVRDTAAAGILVASESSYDSPGSDDIRIEANLVERAGHTVPHPGILVSGLDGPISGTVLTDNVVLDSHSGEPVRVEGEVVGLVVRDGSDDGASGPPPSGSSGADGNDHDEPKARDTSILATRDVSFVAAGQRRGLYRIQVRGDPERGFEQRLEYVVAAAEEDVDLWLADGVEGVRFPSPDGNGDDGDDYIVIRTGTPLELPSALRPVEFEELRAVASDMPQLWQHLDQL
jgi:hypothetical protein